nr:hypothetical protein [Tanacetum cinerariifolium]
MKRLINSEYRDEIKIVELKENCNVTPSLSTDEPDNSLSMRDEHLDTIPATKSDEFIKSSVENLIPIPSESGGILEHMCDVPFHDTSPPLDASPPDSELVCSEVMEIVILKVGGIKDDILLTIQDDILCENLLNVNILFAKIEALNENPTPFYDPISCSDEDVPEKIFSTPLFDEEIIPRKIDQHHDNVESDLIESLRTYDSSLIISSKIDSLLDEFVDILFIEKLLYDNSSPHPPKEFVSANSDAKIESFSPSPIPVEDSDSLMEEIDLFYTSDYPMPSGIKDDDYDSERDILIL